jgi:ribonucleotide monophosphatase NagD (HAD superfamily)
MIRVEKEKRKVTVFCTDGTLISGFVHINPGERILDFLNDAKEEFIAVTSAEFRNVPEIHSFKLVNEFKKKKSIVVLNKSTVKMVEEI